MKKNEEDQLDDAEIVGFYRLVQERFEKDLKNSSKENQLKLDIRPLISHNQTDELMEIFKIKVFDIEPKDSIEKERIRNNMVIQHILKKGDNKNQSTFYSLFFHLRNSVAHSHITVDNDYYVFEDINNKEETSMIGRIKKDIFFNYVETIYSYSQEYQEKQAKNNQ